MVMIGFSYGETVNQWRCDRSHSYLLVWLLRMSLKSEAPRNCEGDRQNFIIPERLRALRGGEDGEPCTQKEAGLG